MRPKKGKRSVCSRRWRQRAPLRGSGWGRAAGRARWARRSTRCAWRSWAESCEDCAHSRPADSAPWMEPYLTNRHDISKMCPISICPIGPIEAKSMGHDRHLIFSQSSRTKFSCSVCPIIRDPKNAACERAKWTRFCIKQLTSDTCQLCAAACACCSSWGRQTRLATSVRARKLWSERIISASEPRHEACLNMGRSLLIRRVYEWADGHLRPEVRRVDLIVEYQAAECILQIFVSWLLKSSARSAIVWGKNSHSVLAQQFTRLREYVSPSLTQPL